MKWIIEINQQAVEGMLKEMLRKSVEDTLNARLDQKAARQV